MHISSDLSMPFISNLTYASRDLTVPYKNKLIQSIITKTEGSSEHICMILTHGAGGDMNLPQLILLAHHLAKHGFLVLRYTCKGLNLQYRINVYKEIVVGINNKSLSIGTDRIEQTA